MGRKRLVKKRGPPIRFHDEYHRGLREYMRWYRNQKKLEEPREEVA